MRNRYMSRKFWVSMIAEITGIIVLLGGNPGDFQTIAGAILVIAAALGYVVVEGKIDREHAK